MADLEVALVYFGKLISLLKDSGELDWSWFGDPLGQSLGQMPSNRKNIGPLFRVLLSRSPDNPDQSFTQDGTYLWEPINLGDIFGAGFVWNASGTDLQIGVGAKIQAPIAGKAVDLAVLAKLIQILNKQVNQAFGQVHFEGDFPVPGFLSAGSISGDTQPLAVSLTVKDTTARTRTVTVPGDANLQWDAVRLALFVLEAWINQEASTNPGNAFYTRTSKHLFPMFGEPDTPTIHAFPFFGDANMGTVPNYGPWMGSVLTTNNNAAGALTFLWHLRALLTGNENPSFLGGSMFFPLIAGAAGNTPPVLANQSGTYPPSLDNVAGAWIGIVGTLPNFTLVIDLRDGKSNSCRIPLGQVAGGTFSRPTLAAADFTAIQKFMAAALPITLTPQQQITATKTGVGVQILTETISGTNIPGFDGTYAFQVMLQSGQPPYFQAVLPAFMLALPPGAGPSPLSPNALLGLAVPWILAAMPSVTPKTLSDTASAMGTLVQGFLTSGTADPKALITALVSAAGTVGKITAGPLEVDFSGTDIKPQLSFGPLGPDQFGDVPISIGTLSASADVSFTSGLTGFTVSMNDLRIGSGNDTVFSGFIGSLIPNLKDAPGFTLSLSWNAPSSISVTGGGTIPVQQSFGPLSLSQLQVDVTGSSLTIGIGISFQLGPITVTAYELGINFPFNGGSPSPFLEGLGLSLNAGGITLEGMFGSVNEPDGTVDYVGGAVVGVEGLFQLSAIGGYSQMKDGTTSIFIFAALMAPLGGPPFLFITGIAGGFGYNRSLPDPQLMGNHPFMQVMNGDIVLSGSAHDELQALSSQFAPAEGDYWIAAGIQFTSFGFINGRIIVVIQFGQNFSITVLGMASFGIDPVAYFEIDIMATGDQEKFLLRAGISPHSYLIHPDIFSLQGDFFLGEWHGGTYAGDFVLSIGGFHPYFQIPPNYPTDLNRAGVKAIIYDFVHVTVECFFACTPQALMAGASVSLSATFAGVGAGLDVYVDVLIQWDPFFILADMGVTVWFEFMGRHEIGVDLTVWTPPFGGRAHISIFVVSFDVSFGSDLNSLPGPTLDEFFTNQLNVPATAWQASGAQLALFSSAQGAGLTQVNFVSGRTSTTMQNTPDQEGIDQPVSMRPEFSFSVTTHLPMKLGNVAQSNPNNLILVGEIDLPLCGLAGLGTSLTVTAPSMNLATYDRLGDMFPAANFGDKLQPAQAADQGARQAVANINSTQPQIALFDGLLIHYDAVLQPSAPPDYTASNEEDSGGLEDYPLPVGWPPLKIPIFKNPVSTVVFATQAATQMALKTPVVARRDQALRLLTSQVSTPIAISAATADMKRAQVPAQLMGTSVASIPSGTPSMAPPPSPGRRAELLAVNLRVVPAHAAAPLRRSIPILRVPPAAVTPVATIAAVSKVPAAPTVSRAPVASAGLKPAAGVVQPPSNIPPVVQPSPTGPGQPPNQVVVPSGKAVLVSFTGGNVQSGSLVFAGQQTVRAIFLTGFGEPLADLQVLGNQTVALPARCRGAALLGEGGAGPIALGNVGIESDTVLLALGQSTYAGWGSLLEVKTLVNAPSTPLDSLRAAGVLRAAATLRIDFPAPPSSTATLAAPAAAPCCLVLTVLAVASNPGNAGGQVRWRSLDATLGGLDCVLTADRAAFAMDVTAAGRWALDLDFGPDWRLAGAVMAQGAAKDMVAYLQGHADWTLVDDRFRQPVSPSSTTVTLEIVNG